MLAGPPPCCRDSTSIAGTLFMRIAVADTRSWKSNAFPVLLAVVCVGLAALSSGDARWQDALEYRRDAIAHGEFWRLVTAHLMHLTPTHAVLDVAGLLLVAWIFAVEIGPRGQVVVCVLGAAAVDFGLWALHPEVDRYVGLSGVLHAWFAAGATRWLLASDTTGDSQQLVHRKRAWGAALLLGLAVKLFLESRQQAFWLDGAAFTVVTAAHRWGAAAGVLYGVAAAFTIARRASAGAASAIR